MLHEDKKAGWGTSGVLWWKRHHFFSGRVFGTGITWDDLEAILRLQVQIPTLVMRDGERQWWLYKNKTYWDETGLAPEDVAALVFEKEQRRARTLQRAHEAVRREGTPEGRRRGPLPRALRLAVWERDEGKCVECGSRFDLQYDHIVPYSLGGADTEANLRILCGQCNQRRGNTI